MRKRVILGVAALAMVAGGFAYAQRYGGGYNEVPFCYSSEECPRTPYDGRFTFVRMHFDTERNQCTNMGRMGGGGEPPWHHDRPEAERNLSTILREISTVRTFEGVTGGNVFGLDDEEIYRYPVLWVSEPGFWIPTDEQVRSLRDYLLKGGFMIFDDFSACDTQNLIFQMNRVLPESAAYTAHWYGTDLAFVLRS